MSRNLSIRETNGWYWVVSHLVPKRLIYFCFMHVLAFATTHEKYKHTEAPALAGLDAIILYGDENDL